MKNCRGRTEQHSLAQACIVVRGAGDLASGVALRLWRAGLRRLLLLETPRPMAVRRRVAFSEAVYTGRCHVEEVEGRLLTAPGAAPFSGGSDGPEAARPPAGKEQMERPAAEDFHWLPAALHEVWSQGAVAVLVDPAAACLGVLRGMAAEAPGAACSGGAGVPATDGGAGGVQVLIEATLSKRPMGLHPGMASLVLALGPGSVAGEHVHAVIETQRGPTLGRVIRSGAALPNTGVPGPVCGLTLERVLRAPCAGVFRTALDIGAQVDAGQAVGGVTQAAGHGEKPGAALPVYAGADGVVRGLLRDGALVDAGTKLGDIDPRRDVRCDLVTEKALALGGGVLEAVLAWHLGMPDSRR